MTRRTVIKVVLWMVVAYLAIAACFGFQVGHAIAVARANPFAAVGARIAGPDVVEQAAITTAATPRIFVVSPTFWIALKLSE